MTDRISNHVVFIHGAWMVPACWDDFRKPFEAAGYTVHAPAWPTVDSGTPAELRANPPAGLGGLSVGAIADHYAGVVASLPEPPLIVGHSFGGLFTQLLLDRGLGAAGIAIDPAPVGGVIPGLLPLLAATPVLLRWNGWNRTYPLTKANFDRNFANRAPAALRDAAYDRLVVPTSGKIFYQAAFSVGTWVKPARRIAPLLITVGEKDRTVTPFTARGNYRVQKKSSARTDFKQFAGHSHFLIGEPGWEDVAAYCLDWAGRL
ncbi:MAG: alpha/beta hydrolase [Sphingomonas sp.]